MFLNKFLKFSKISRADCLSSHFYNLSNVINSQKRRKGFIFEWFINVFNRVNKERLELLNPDCVCAEWLLRNGASVLLRGQSTLLSDYNELIKLEETQANQLLIEEIYAQNADLNSVGFEHLKGCNHVKKITLILCYYVNDSVLFKLNYVKESLQYLEIRSCFNVKDVGVNALCDLRNLKSLTLANLVSVKNKYECEAFLKKALPQCKIDFQK